jgi:hypothetical protein
MAKRKNQEPLRDAGHFMRVNGELVSIDPFKTNLPERCKLAMAEMMTGRPHVIAGEVKAK